jgi:hypothetical protein
VANVRIIDAAEIAQRLPFQGLVSALREAFVVGPAGHAPTARGR